MQHQGLLSAAFPPTGSFYLNTPGQFNVEGILHNTWLYTVFQLPLGTINGNYADCPWALSNFEVALGGVRDCGDAIAGFLDRSWGILEQGLAPRFEQGNQGNQRAPWALNLGLLGHSALVDFAVGVDLGDSQFATYTTAAPNPDFEIALQTDTVSWHRVQSEVMEYELHRELVVALVATPDGPRLRAADGFLDSEWKEWLPTQLFGFQVAHFDLEQLRPGGDDLRIATLLADGTLHAFDRSLTQTTTPSPMPRWIANGASHVQLAGDRIGWLSGGDLWVQEGLTAQGSMVLNGVDAFQIEGRRIGALVGNVLRTQDGPGQPWITQLSNVAEFKLTESLSAALTTGGLLKAQWGWRATETEGAAAMTDAGGWNLPQFYATIRTEVVGGDVYLVARGGDAVVAYTLETATGAWRALPSLVAMTDSGGWDVVQHYSTIRTAVVGDSIYLLARAADGIIGFRFDTVSETWSALPSLAVMTNAAGWDAGPWYYSTLRTEVVGDDIYLLGRAANALLIYRFDTLAGAWQTLPSTGGLTDAAGWNQEPYYATIRAEVVGDIVYLLARSGAGIITLRFDTVSDTWLPVLPTYSVMTDALGWNAQRYFASLRTEVVGTDVVLLGRSGSGVVAYALDSLTNSWSALPSYGVLTDADRWYEGPYYAEMRTEVIGDDLYLLARANGGVGVHKLERGASAWDTVSLGWPYWTDFGGWDKPEYFRTLRTEVVGSTLHLLARYEHGVLSYALETDPQPWRTLARNVSQFDLAGNFLAVDAPPPQNLQGVRQRTPVLLGSVAPVPSRSLHVVQLGAVPLTLGSAMQWAWSSMLTQGEIARFRIGGDTKNHSARGFWWLTTGLEDGTLVDYGRQGYLTRSWRQHLPVAKETQSFDDTRIEVTIPAEAASRASLADRQAVLIGGDLYVKDVW